jgi:stress-induced morphogen
MATEQELLERLQKAFPGAAIQVRDLTGSGAHFEARVKSAAFVGKSMREQHQLVYREVESLAAHGELHALALITEPAE